MLMRSIYEKFSNVFFNFFLNIIVYLKSKPWKTCKLFSVPAKDNKCNNSILFVGAIFNAVLIGNISTSNILVQKVEEKREKKISKRYSLILYQQ